MLNAHAALALGYDLGTRPRFTGCADNELPTWLTDGEEGLELADVDFDDAALRRLQSAGLTARRAHDDGSRVFTYGGNDDDPGFILAVKVLETDANTTAPVPGLTPPDGWEQQLAAAVEALGLDVGDAKAGWLLAPYASF